MTLNLWLLTPVLIEYLFGQAYIKSIPILKIMSILPLLIAIGSSLGRFILLPFHMDRERLVVFSLTGAINIILGICLSLIWQGVGMALLVVVCESIVTLGFLWIVHKKHLNPLW